MNTSNHIAIELDTNEYVFDKDNNLEKSTMTGRYLSEMYLDKKTADTRDFTKYESGQLWDEMPKVDFKKTFGFDYSQYDKAFDLGIAFVNAQGFSIDLDNATMSQDIYEQSGEMWYEMNNMDKNSPMVEKMMSGVKYDAINAVSCSYVIDKDNTDNLYIKYFTATVNYTKDKKNISKCITCKFILFGDDSDEEMTDSCGFGEASDCNTGESNGNGCESDCDMEDQIKGGN